MLRRLIVQLSIATSTGMDRLERYPLLTLAEIAEEVDRWSRKMSGA